VDLKIYNMDNKQNIKPKAIFKIEQQLIRFSIKKSILNSRKIKIK